MATKESCRFMSAKAAQRVGRSMTSSTMWPIQRKQITVGSLPAMRVAAGLRLWNDLIILVNKHDCSGCGPDLIGESLLNK